ncbi:uncharacterized membrane protein (UPF0136 family) [Nocardioides luteus]|uniref:Uncharacterized protein n=1 Tax=Nocardioides luteus TaxID=1844 RepID=A0ABQ5SUQ0_9ACTN|nr:hypothetical protein [Nocardioides luteus]MDR7309130.1 uncharacterized membrane protein (UPF0136 family) [Nocardioides luteus]GGR49587.1 hypothetical protein GCM10010197_14410 [Nocardioides luteus]GLJ67536.1 hypothetical protein GCM10017579_15720 [Nocardioides luteus]
MVTAPLALVLGIISFFMTRGSASTIAGTIVNVLFGIALASTILGPPMISGLESGSNAVIQGVSDSIGAGR